MKGGMMKVAEWDAAIAPLAVAITEGVRDKDVWGDVPIWDGSIFEPNQIGYRERWRRTVPGVGIELWVTPIIQEFTTYFIREGFYEFCGAFQEWRESLPAEIDETELEAMRNRVRSACTGRLKQRCKDAVLAAAVPAFHEFRSGHKDHDRYEWRPGRWEDTWRASRAAAIESGALSISEPVAIDLTGTPTVPPLPEVDFAAAEAASVYDEMTPAGYIPGSIPATPYYTPNGWFDYSGGATFELIGSEGVNLSGGSLAYYQKPTSGATYWMEWNAGETTDIVVGSMAAIPLTPENAALYWKPFNTGTLTGKFGY